MNISIEEQIEKILEEIRPALKQHQGDIELVRFDAERGEVHVRLRGACHGCPLAGFTLSTGVQTVLTRAIPEVTRVVQDL